MPRLVLTALLVLVATTTTPTMARAQIFGAVLPTSRSVQVGVTATAFATVINSGSSAATNCSIAPLTNVAASFLYQTTNASNVLVGTPNQPVTIPGTQFQTFLIAFTPSAPFSATDVALNFDCDNTDPAPVVPGLNTLSLSASTTPVPDVVALAATIGNTGIVNLLGDTGPGVFAVATVNVGSAAMIRVSAESTVGSLDANAFNICQTDAQGNCL